MSEPKYIHVFFPELNNHNLKNNSVWICHAELHKHSRLCYIL